MSRKKPVMAIEIFDAELALAVLGFVKLLDDLASCGLDSAILAVDIINEDGQTLGSVPELGGTRLLRLRLPHHDASAAEPHLRPSGRFTISVVLGKSEHSGEPGYCLRKILIHDVGQEDVSKYRPVLQHTPILKRGAG